MWNKDKIMIEFSLFSTQMYFGYCAAYAQEQLAVAWAVWEDSMIG